MLNIDVSKRSNFTSARRLNESHDNSFISQNMSGELNLESADSPMRHSKKALLMYKTKSTDLNLDSKLKKASGFSNLRQSDNSMNKSRDVLDSESSNSSISDGSFFDQIDVMQSQIKRDRKYSIRVKIPRNFIEENVDDQEENKREFLFEFDINHEIKKLISRY